jgi:plasmid replication initiation protein
MALFPRRHKQKDFFILDMADVVPKDDTASMEHPFFSLATKPDMRHLHYKNGNNTLEIIPSGLGLPTIFDKDILIFCVSQLMHRKNQGKPIGKTVRFSARELSIATNRPIGGNHYKRLEKAFQRLRGATFTTNIRSGDKIENRTFGMIDEGGFVRTADEKFKLDYCEVSLSDWIMNAIESSEVLSIHEDYFRIRRPLERRIYEICRKHCGNQKQWKISLENLQIKTGSNAPSKRFRLNIRQIIAEDVTPFYRLSLGADDIVMVKPRKAARKQISHGITIPAWAEEKAREIAQAKGWDYYQLEREWQEFADNPKDAGAAFVGFCKRKESLR